MITRRRIRCQTLRSGRPSSHTLIRAERSTLDSQTLPLGRNETIRDGPNRLRSRNEIVRPRDRVRNRSLRQRPPNRKALGNRLTSPPVPQRAADHPEHTVERSDHDSQTSTEDSDTRIDDEPFHHKAHGTSASVTTTRKPMLRAYTTRVVERAGKRNTIAETNFKSDLSCWVNRYVASLYCTVLYDVNVVLFQHTPNLLNILHSHASNDDAAVDLTVTVLNNFDFKRDTVQTKNDFPAQ